MNVIEKIIDIYRVKFRDKIYNPIWGGQNLKRINYKKFTIISNNCWGGHVYRYFSSSYDSPTVGLYFFAEDYMRFLGDLRSYISKDLNFIRRDESKYREELERRNVTCPIGILGDVEVVFLHYKTEAEALNKWNRRCQRIHWDSLYIKFSEMNLCNLRLLEEFDRLDYQHKIVFTTKDYGLKSQVIFKDYEGSNEINNDTLHFRKFINLIKWINGEKDFRRNQ